MDDRQQLHCCLTECLTYVRRLGSVLNDMRPVDIVSDAGTRRAVLEMLPPPSPVVLEILRGPSPPKYERQFAQRFADGVDSINFLCSRRLNIAAFYIPTAEEVIEEIFLEQGYEIQKDEKRSSYLPTIDRFGSIKQSAFAFTGKTGEILSYLYRNRSREVKATTPRQIRSKCNLGDGTINDADYMTGIEAGLKGRSDREKRIAVRRFREYARFHVPSDASLHSLLETWVNRSILRRFWLIKECVACHYRDAVERLDIQRPVICSNCGNQLELGSNVSIGYRLDGWVEHSIKEGIVPVALTGNFLRNLTLRGFFWLPGVKYHRDEESGDVDLVACCDGALVFAECKDLRKTPHESKIWDDATNQFLKMAHVASECNASVAVLATMADEFPPRVTEQIAYELQGRVGFALLDHRDLENGYRSKPDGPTEWPTMRAFLDATRTGKD